MRSNKGDPVDEHIRRKNRRDGAVIVGVMLCLLGAGIALNEMLNPYEVCNAFRCYSQTDIGVVLFGLAIVAVGVWLLVPKRRQDR